MSLTITVCHHWARLVMPIDDPQDGFKIFYPTLTLMIYSYTITACLFTAIHTSTNGLQGCNVWQKFQRVD